MANLYGLHLVVEEAVANQMCTVRLRLYRNGSYPACWKGNCAGTGW